MRSQHKEHLDRNLHSVFAPEPTGSPAKRKSRIPISQCLVVLNARGEKSNFKLPQFTLGSQHNRKGGGPRFFHDGFPDTSDESGPPDAHTDINNLTVASAATSVAGQSNTAATEELWNTTSA